MFRNNRDNGFDFSEIASNQSSTKKEMPEEIPASENKQLQNWHFIDESNAAYPAKSTVSKSEYVEKYETTAHYLLLYWMNQLKFDVDVAGVCHGYTYMACLSFLALGHLDLFYQRLNLIRDYHVYELIVDSKKELAAIAERNKYLPDTEKIIPNEQHLEAMDLLAFFNGIKLCQDPEKFPEIFAHSTVGVDYVSRLNASTLIQAKGGLIADKRWQFAGAYSDNELFLFLIQLDKAAKAHNINFCIFMSANDHEVGLLYSAEYGHWYFIDANKNFSFNDKAIPFTEENAEDLLPELWDLRSLDKDLSDEGDEFLLLHCQFAAVQSDRDAIKVLFDCLANDEEVQTLHQVTMEKINYESKNNNLAWLCAESGSHKLLQAAIDVICNDDALDVQQANNLLHRFLNKPSTQGDFPIHLAACRGYVDIVQTLCETKVLMEADNGDLPSHDAASSGQVAVLKALARCGVDLDRANILGETPLTLAKRNQRTEVVKFLQDNFVKKKRKKPSNTFFTPDKKLPRSQHSEASNRKRNLK